MRLVRYSVAISLDGYIAGPNGEHDWIIMDPAIDFASFFKAFDTVLLGRRTFEMALRHGPQATVPDMRAFVFSRTLRAQDYPDVTIVADEAAATVADLRSGTGKDIWLMGGGVLFRSLLDARLVDTVEVAVVPILLGQGIPFLPPPSRTARLDHTRTETFPSGIVSVAYTVRREAS